MPVLSALGAGIAIVALGITYLTVECQALPALLGGTAGDTSPRSRLGIACVVIGALVVLVGAFMARRRPPAPPRRS